MITKKGILKTDSKGLIYENYLGEFSFRDEKGYSHNFSKKKDCINFIKKYKEGLKWIKK